MKLHEKLRSEFTAPVNGTFAPFYFRYLGYRDNMYDPMPILRAKGIQALFSKPAPRIFVNDLIVGNRLGLYCDENESLMNHAKTFVSRMGSRGFGTNSDHFAPNYDHTLALGVTGLINEVEESLKVHSADQEKCDTLSAMKITLEGFRQMIANYADKARDLMGDPEYDTERLSFIEKNCTALVSSAPKSFAEALQLVWLCHTAFMMECRYAMALGRIDQYLYPFYKKDIDAGIITNEEVIELLENAFTKIPDDVVNICIGGMDADGNCQVNELSYCVLFAVKSCNRPGPNLSARITPNTPDEFLIECLKSIGTGLGYPALMNDSVNIPALAKYGYEYKDVCNYSMVGCIENFITGMQPPWSDGRFDTPRFFDYVFNNGISEFSKTAGLDLGDVEDIKSMDEFMENFEAQLKLGAQEYCRMFNSFNDNINQKYYPEPFLSCFCYDCIGRGLDINNGGSIYPSVHGVGIMGVGTVADSLAAIEKVVFIDKAATLVDIKNALNANFEGYEELRETLLNAPKYGNNDDFVDKYAVWFADYLTEQFGKFTTRDGGGIYVLMAANTNNISAGKLIAATPDGRKAGEPLSDAASPTYGRDTGGATVTLTSVVKPDYTNAAGGSVVNQKFSPAMFEGEKLNKLLALIKVYFKKGGQEIQMNATSRKVLLDAMEHPENYRDLVVRVSGFSAYFVTLGRDVQLDILSRTQHE